LRSTRDELALKYGRSEFKTNADQVMHSHFGTLIVSCDKADLRPLPSGVMIYGDAEQRLDPLPPPEVPRAEVIDELYGAIVEGRAPLPSGEWALATVEVCRAQADRREPEERVCLPHPQGTRARGEARAAGGGSEPDRSTRRERRRRRGDAPHAARGDREPQSIFAPETLTTLP